MENKRIVVIVCLFFIFSLVTNYILLSNYFENNEFLTSELVEGFKVQGVFLIPSISFSAFFIIWMITKKEVSKNLENLIYSWPKEGLTQIIDSTSKKSIIGFFLLSTFITGSVWYVVGISTSEVLLSLIPFTDFVPEIKGPCESIATLLNDLHEDIEHFLLLVGPIWVMILKRSRDYEVKHDISKQRGIRTLVLFFWAIVILFVADNMYELGCMLELEPGIYTIPPSPAYYLYSGLNIATIYAGPVTILIFVLNKYFQKLFNVSKN